MYTAMELWYLTVCFFYLICEVLIDFTGAQCQKTEHSENFYAESTQCLSITQQQN